LLDVSGDVLHIAFEHDLKQTSRLLYWYSPEIDRYNTKSVGDEWRLELRVGDFIDGFDTTKVWYQSTIQDT